MAVSNSGIEDLSARIADLQRKIKLTKSNERKQMFQDEINSIMDQIKNHNRKKPSVVPVKNASTVGDSIERKTKSKSSQSRLENGRIML